MVDLVKVNDKLKNVEIGLLDRQNDVLAYQLDNPDVGEEPGGTEDPNLEPDEGVGDGGGEE